MFCMQALCHTQGLLAHLNRAEPSLTQLVTPAMTSQNVCCDCVLLFSHTLKIQWLFCTVFFMNGWPHCKVVLMVFKSDWTCQHISLVACCLFSFFLSEMNAVLTWLHANPIQPGTLKQDWIDRWEPSFIFWGILHWSWQPMDVHLHLWDNQSYDLPWVTKGSQWVSKEPGINKVMRGPLGEWV